MQSEYQTDWNQISLDIMSDLIWVQTFCKGYSADDFNGRIVNILATMHSLSLSRPD